MPPGSGTDLAPFTLFAPAKVNLALHVLGRRADGYHDLDSIVAFADVGDWLSFSPAEKYEVTVDGPFAAAVPETSGNIITRAWEAATLIAARRERALPPVRVHLSKNLPVASGIGGGSSNAAAALKGFLRIAGINGLDDEIIGHGLKIGADVPVCLQAQACRMQGVGERIVPLAGFAPRRAILVNPLVEVSTPEVFRGLGLARGDMFAGGIEDADNAARWRNDLAAPAIAQAPVIGQVLAMLSKAHGVTRAFMSGSGATCVGLYEGEPGELKLDPRWWMARTVLS